jgi:TolA-binding protein
MGGALMEELHQLGRHMASSLLTASDGAEARARARSRFLAGEGQAARKPIALRPAPVAVALAFVAAFAVLVTHALLAPQPVLTIALDAPSGRTPIEVGGLVVAPSNAEAPITFADGTRVTLERGSRVRIASVDAHGARVLLEHGELHANVAHLRGANWTFDAGPFQVLVTGTRFDVTWDPETESLVVTLLEGSVNVRGCSLASMGQRVVAGQRLRASCKDVNASIGPLNAPAKPSLSFEAPPAPEEPKSASAIPIAALPSAAPTTAPMQSGRPPVVAPSAPEPSKAANVAPSGVELTTARELLKGAEDARFAHDVPRAKALLLELRRRFPATEPAAMAAFELGRIAFDSDGDYGRAGEWFERVLKERPDVGYAREALGRALEAKARAGDTEGAKQAAERYLAIYPDGPHAAFARRAIDQAALEERPR